MIDYRRVFTETLLEVMDEEFKKQGIDTLDEETFSEIVTTETRNHFWPSLKELHHQQGIDSLGGFRPRW